MIVSVCAVLTGINVEAVGNNIEGQVDGQLTEGWIVMLIPSRVALMISETFAKLNNDVSSSDSKVNRTCI